MKRVIAAALTSIAVAAPAAVIAAPAQASEPYVTKAEFRQVSKGMTMARVHRIFDVSGTQSYYESAYPSLGIPAEQSREYRTKSSWGSVDIDYVRRDGVWYVKRKDAFWG
jgi:hypothetical protein